MSGIRENPSDGRFPQFDGIAIIAGMHENILKYTPFKCAISLSL